VEHLRSLRCVMPGICAVPYARSVAEVSDIRSGRYRVT
jgi:hypothetical protein